MKKNCIDCGKELGNRAIYYGTLRCRSCAAKERLKISENNPNFKHGRSIIKHFCKRCNIEISYGSAEFGNGFCSSCWQLGEKNNFYIDGQYNRNYPEEFNIKLKRIIRNRDKYSCQECGLSEKEHLIKVGFPLSVHHIDYNKENCKESNLILLCNSCHSKTNFNRDNWKDYYKKILVIRGVK
jgi:hypothetical protein